MEHDSSSLQYTETECLHKANSSDRSVLQVRTPAAETSVQARVDVVELLECTRGLIVRGSTTYESVRRSSNEQASGRFGFIARRPYNNTRHHSNSLSYHIS